jgi:hypothetical protein
MVQGHVTEEDISLNHPKVYREEDNKDKTGRQEKTSNTRQPIHHPRMYQDTTD